MKAAGADVVKHIDELAFMGFIEVLANLRTILRNFKLCEEQIKAFQPDLVVLVDYPGFNLRMAKKIHLMGIKTAYYISPQIWAWKESRVNQIKRFIDHVFVILPFEKAFFKKHGVEAEYVGHPLLDEIKLIQPNRSDFLKKHAIQEGQKLIAVLPGSREQELNKILPVVKKVAAANKQYHFAISKVAWLEKSLYGDLPLNASFVEGDTYDLLKLSQAAIVTSGTATLETALLKTPQVVVYKANWLSVLIARNLVKIKYISLVNLIMDKLVVQELIQSDANASRISEVLTSILPGGSTHASILDEYDQLAEKLGGEGASSIVANRLLKIADK